MIKSLCVNCGSNFGAHPDYRSAATRLGQLLGQRGIRLVYGGAEVGLMGEVANSSLGAGAEVVGVITEALNSKVGHRGLTRLEVVSTMHERKSRMFELSDAFLVMPGGYGTLEEALELLTWAQLGQHDKPIGFLNVRGYFDPLMRFLDNATEQRFLKVEHRAIAIAASDPGDLLLAMDSYRPANVAKWFES